MNIKYLQKIIVCFIVVSVLSISVVEAQERTEPFELLKIFYDNLLSEKSLSECEKIFSDPESSASAISKEFLDKASNNLTATEKWWYYLRKNKSVFLFPGYSSELILERGGKAYVFTGFGRRRTFFDGIFGVKLFAPLSKRGEEGVWKEIFFPLEKNTKPVGPYYLIDIVGVKINGISLDITNEFNRSGNLYEQLGFKVEKEKSEKQKNRGQPSKVETN